LRSAILASWELLDPPARTALAQLSVLPEPVSADTAEALVDVDDDPVNVLADLLDHSLLRRDEAGLLGLLPSIRDFGAEHLVDRSPVIERLAAWYASRPGGPTERESRLLSLDDAIARCAASQAASILLGLAPTLHDEGPIDLLIKRCEAVRRLDSLGPTLVQELLCAEALAQIEVFETERASRLVEEARRLGDSVATDLPQIVLDRLAGRAEAATMLGRRALGRHDLTTEQRSRLLVETAHAAWLAAHLDEAGAYLDEARALIGPNPRIQARIHMLEGGLHFDRGRLQDALREFETALDTLRCTSARLDASSVHERIGTALIRLGRFDEATPHFEEMGRLGNLAGSALALARSRENLGKVALDRGDLPHAEAMLREAADTLEAAGHLYRASTARSNLGQALARQGRLDEAEQHLLRALAVQQHGTRTLGTPLHILCMVNLLQGRPETARERITEVVAAHERHGMRRSAAVSRSALGHIALEAGDADAAVPVLGQAVDTLAELGSWPAWAAAGVVLGTALAGAGRQEDARRRFTEAEVWIRDADMLEDLGRLLCAKGLAQVGWGELEAARAALDEARPIAGICGSKPNSELGRSLTQLSEALELPTVSRA
jgi:tetratricopeptide (TPR) repeat protein